LRGQPSADDRRSRRPSRTPSASCGSALHDPNGHDATSVAFSPDGETLAVTTNYKRTIGSIYLWNVTTRNLTATLDDPGSTGTSADAFSPDGSTLEVSDGNLNNYLWNMKWLPS
jgi:WD40 repeat protein